MVSRGPGLWQMLSLEGTDAVTWNQEPCSHSTTVGNALKGFHQYVGNWAGGLEIPPVHAITYDQESQVTRKLRAQSCSMKEMKGRK